MILRLERLSKRYRRPNGTKVALDEVSLELDRGQIMGVFGPSGAGKTTLLRIAAGLESPDSGQVLYKGEPLELMSPTQRTGYLRREIGCVWPAQPWSEGLGVMDHVALPLLVDRCDRRIAEHRARRVLVACDADDTIGMDLHQLSDGERQLVGIARALVTEPRLLLVDSAVGNLSVMEQETIMGLLSELAREAGVAVLVTGTEAFSVLRADPLLYLRDGKLINGKPMSELGRIYNFPSAGSRQAAADA
jgi:ABC-type methionine transport system ATPase subunit